LEDGYIKKFHLSTDIEVSELAGWGIDTNRMTNRQCWILLLVVLEFCCFWW
jgi:hypothetical protein